MYLIMRLWMHIINSIIHYCCSYVFACISKCPSLFYVQIQSGFALGLTVVFQVPLVLI
uniref:Uncharacterized protein n=1 Tax=Meloidogyne incognita TaxID=6306 RepID=A0A914MVE1_MELIC